MNAPTIVVEGFSGEKHITREEFVKQWVDHAKQFWRLDWDLGNEIIPKVEEKAGSEFDRILAKQ